MVSKMTDTMAQFMKGVKEKKKENNDFVLNSYNGGEKTDVKDDAVVELKPEVLVKQGDGFKETSVNENIKPVRRGRKKGSRFGKVPKRYPFQLSQELYDDIQNVAFEEGISVNQFITKAVVEKLESLDK